MSNEICSLCLEIVTNPVCNNCYLRQINSWLRNMGIAAVPRSILLGKIKERTGFENLNEDNCILCGNGISMCSYCFFRISRRVLREFNFPENIIQVFEAEFSYNEV